MKLQSSTLFWTWTVNVLLLLAACKPLDVRSPAISSAMNGEGAEVRGRDLLARAAKTHNAARWAQFDSVQVDMRHTFKKLKFAAPFPGPTCDLGLTYTDDFVGAVTFKTGRWAGRKWGASYREGWIQKPGKERKPTKKDQVWLWVLTYQYFLAFPHMIQQATYVRDAGQRKVGEDPYNLVFASWNTAEPQRDIDQYLIYLDPKTDRIAFVEFTVRAVFPGYHGVMLLQDYAEMDGILLPRRLVFWGPVASLEKGGGVLHQMEVQGFKPFVSAGD